MKIFLLLSLCHCVLLTTAQDVNNQITYSVNTKQLDKLDIQKLGLRIHLNYDPDYEISLANSKQGIYYFKLKSEGLYKIADGFGGHMIFLEKGDSVKIPSHLNHKWENTFEEKAVILFSVTPPVF